jgi:hypothetical protein
VSCNCSAPLLGRRARALTKGTCLALLYKVRTKEEIGEMRARLRDDPDRLLAFQLQGADLVNQLGEDCKAKGVSLVSRSSRKEIRRLGRRTLTPSRLSSKRRRRTRSSSPRSRRSLTNLKSSRASGSSSGAPRRSTTFGTRFSRRSLKKMDLSPPSDVRSSPPKLPTASATATSELLWSCLQISLSLVDFLSILQLLLHLRLLRGLLGSQGRRLGPTDSH